MNALLVTTTALVAHGASSARIVTAEPGPDSSRVRTSDERDAVRPRARVVFYGRLGVPFMPRDHRVALSGAPVTPRRSNAAPRKTSRPCPAETQPAHDDGAPALARRGGVIGS